MLRAFLFIVLAACLSCQTTANVTVTATIRMPATRAALLRSVTLAPRQVAVPASTPTTPSPAATPDADPAIIGYSVDGHPLTLWRFGEGARGLLLVGGIHGGWESNTVVLMDALIEHFGASPQDVPPQVTLLIVPNANPDGSKYEGIPRGRFNGNGVDLNRNWSCGWSSEAFWRNQRINPGLAPLSEPETQALEALMRHERPAVALFFHSAANGIFAGTCEGDNSAAPDEDHSSAAMAAVFGEAAGYPYDAPFTAYPVSGTASDWADGQGIASADVELSSHEDAEYDQNLRGVLALLAWLAQSP